MQSLVISTCGVKVVRDYHITATKQT